ncbi:MAG TPA: NAD(P)-dependent oxidoreductase, partial [Sneathiellales bacterium]|nr:NAD(P)-dependent oxidoreductase [Sneathiellales bacterium]
MIRPFNVVGCGCPGNLLPGAIRDRILVAESGSSIAVGNMEPKRDFVHVEDVAQAIVGLSVGDIGEIEVNICSGSPTGVCDFVNEMICV